MFMITFSRLLFKLTETLKRTQYRIYIYRIHANLIISQQFSEVDQNEVETVKMHTIDAFSHTVNMHTIDAFLIPLTCT